MSKFYFLIEFIHRTTFVLSYIEIEKDQNMFQTIQKANGIIKQNNGWSNYSCKLMSLIKGIF
jgi:hypothetical protein